MPAASQGFYRAQPIAGEGWHKRGRRQAAGEQGSPVDRFFGPRLIRRQVADAPGNTGATVDLRSRKLQSGSAPMALFGWTGDNGDPDNFFDVLLGCKAARPGGNNIAKWCDPEFDTLVSAAKRMSDQSSREPLYRRAQVIAKAEAPWLPIAHSIVFMATRKEVTGFRMDPLGRRLFDGIDLK